jgi:hypothetical protein
MLVPNKLSSLTKKILRIKRVLSLTRNIDQILYLDKEEVWGQVKEEVSEEDLEMEEVADVVVEVEDDGSKRKDE